MTQDQILEAVFTKQSDAIQQVIKRVCIVEFGVVIEVLGDNIVKVGVSVANNIEDVQIMTCTLISPCSASLALNIEPSVGDKVLILSPRHFNPAMFEVSTEDLAPIIDDSCQGYTRLAGLAILMNQFDYDKHKTNLQISKEGDFTLELPYSDSESNVISMKSESSGDFVLDLNGKTTLTIDKNGNVEVATKGKYKIKNDSVDLKAVIDGLAQEVENLTTFGSPASHSVTPASKASIATWRSGKLNQLLD